MRKLFVTGGAGFIGVNFIHYWKQRYPEDFIVNLDALTYAGSRESQAQYEDEDFYYFVHGDICDQELLHEIFTGVYECLPKPDIIVHFAAETHVDRSIDDPSAFVRTNVLGTHNLLDMALQHGKIRFHHVSTDEVFGHLGPDDDPFHEGTSYAPRSPYSASKAASDHLVRSYYETYGLPVTISNCSNNYGPYQFPEKLIPVVISKLLNGEQIPVYGDGSNIRDWIHVDDHSRALEQIILHGEAGESYCLGGNNEVSNLELVKMILHIMEHPEERISFVPDRAGHDWRYAIDHSKMQKHLGWQPEVDFRKGLERTVQWYLDNEDWWRGKIGA